MVLYSAQPAQLPMVIHLLPPSPQASQENEANLPYTLSFLSTFPYFWDTIRNPRASWSKLGVQFGIDLSPPWGKD